MLPAGPDSSRVSRAPHPAPGRIETGGFDRTPVPERVRDLGQHVTSTGKCGPAQPGADRVVVRDALDHRGERHYLAADACPFGEQHAIGLDARAVIVTEPVEGALHGVDGAGRRWPLSRAGRPAGGVGKLAVQTGERQPFRTVPAQRPARDREQGLPGAAGQHQQPGAHRMPGILVHVAQQQGRCDRGDTDLGRARAGAVQ
jgi:hypothetical protein